MLVLPEVEVIHLPCGVFRLQKIIQALFLLLLANVEEKFQHQISIVRKPSLKSPHTSDALLVGFRIHAIHQHIMTDLGHPAGIHEKKTPCFGNLRHESSQKRLPLFLRRGLMHGHRSKESRIQILDDSSQQRSLTCRTPALEQDQHRQIPVLHLHLLCKKPCMRLCQPVLQFLRLRFQ